MNDWDLFDLNDAIRGLSTDIAEAEDHGLYADALRLRRKKDQLLGIAERCGMSHRDLAELSEDGISLNHWRCSVCHGVSWLLEDEQATA